MMRLADCCWHLQHGEPALYQYRDRADTRVVVRARHELVYTPTSGEWTIRRSVQIDPFAESARDGEARAEFFRQVDLNAPGWERRTLPGEIYYNDSKNWPSDVPARRGASEIP